MRWLSWVVLVACCNGDEASRLRDEANRQKWVNPQRVVELMTRAIAIEPSNAKNYALRGLAFADLEQFDRAISDLNVAVMRSPEEATPLVLRCNVHARRHEFEAAFADCDRALAKSRDRIDRAFVFGNRAAILDAQKKYAEAEAAATRSLAEADTSEGHKLRGRMRMYLGRGDEAADDFAKIDLRDRSRWSLIGRLQVELGRYGAGLIALDTAVALATASEVAELQMVRSVAFSAMGQHERAIDALTKALASERDTKRLAFLYNNRGWELMMSGRAKDALPDVEKSLELVPNNSNMLGTRCAIRYELGDVANARRDCAVALELDPESLEAQGLAAFVNGNAERALQTWTTSLERNPDKGWFLRPWIERARRANHATRGPQRKR